MCEGDAGRGGGGVIKAHKQQQNTNVSQQSLEAPLKRPKSAKNIMLQSSGGSRKTLLLDELWLLEQTLSGIQQKQGFGRKRWRLLPSALRSRAERSAGEDPVNHLFGCYQGFTAVDGERRAPRHRRPDLHLPVKASGGRAGLFEVTAEGGGDETARKAQIKKKEGRAADTRRRELPRRLHGDFLSHRWNL